MGIYTKEKIVHHHSKERREFLSKHNMDEKCHTTQKMMSNYFVYPGSMDGYKQENFLLHLPLRA